MNNNARARSEDRSGHEKQTRWAVIAASFSSYRQPPGACAMQVSTAGAEGANAIAPPRRALTGRDASGKSVFQSFDVTPQV